MSFVKAIGLCAVKSRSAVLSATYSTGLPGLLSDVNVLDMTRIVAGPFCTMTLGDLGANVIKVESLDGDESRKWGPPFVPGIKDAYYFLSVNRNKKSICIDLKTQAGREVFYDLAKKSDVMVENFVPGKLDEMQLGYEKLNQLNERLIYCAITGFGPTGPYSKDPGYDVIAAAVGGLLNCTGQRDGEPVKPAVPLTDMCTGLHAFGAIMTALYHRMKTGKGQRIDCNLLSTQVNVMLNIAFTYLNCNIEGQKWGTAHASIVPYQAFPTSDGHYVIGAGSDSQFVQLCKRIGREDLVADERFKTNPDRVKHRSEIIKIVSDVIKTRTKNEWKAVFKGASFPNGPVNTMKEVFEDEHINEIGLVQNVEHPDAGTLRMVGPPTVYSEGGNLIRSPPPQLGQHTEEVLGTFLGYKTEKINDLFSNKIEPAEPVTVITLRPPRKQERKKVVWAEDTVDNENMNKKKSKCCCIYEKPHKFGESDSEDSSDECEHCSGHVERRGKHGHHHQQTTPSADVTDGTTVQPTETVTVAAEPPAILTLRPTETTAPLTSQPTELRPAPPDKGADLPAKSS